LKTKERRSSVGFFDFVKFRAFRGFLMGDRLESMKTTIDIPDELLADAMRFTGAKTKREAVVRAMEDFNRARKVEALLKLAGSIPNFPTNDEIEAGDLARQKRLDVLWNR
jgi:Arc/MetJ family transcription regulator